MGLFHRHIPTKEEKKKMAGAVSISSNICILVKVGKNQMEHVGKIDSIQIIIEAQLEVVIHT